MSLKTIGTIAIPNAEGSEFDHAAFDPKSRRVFVAHTARDCVEVIDHAAGRHLATLPGRTIEEARSVLVSACVAGQSMTNRRPGRTH
jgi:hypothetical protein